MATTDAGLPYPTGQDLLADTDKYIADLAAAVDHALANVSLVAGSANVTCNASGDFTLPITAFATLTGIVFEAFGGSYTTLPIITGLSAGGITGRIWQQQRTTEGYSCLPYGGAVQLNYLAWGVPR